MKLTNVRAVIFDMDGLLVDSERLAHATLIETAKMFGIVPDIAMLIRMIGLPVDGSLDILHRRYGQDFPAEKYIREAAMACEALVLTGGLELKAGATELLAFLDEARLPKAIATSSSREKAMCTLAAVQMADRFNVVVSRTDVPRGKPSPDLFLRAAKELGRTADQCVVLEDSYNGVRAAHAAGMRVIMVPDLMPPNAEMSEVSEAIVPDLFAVLDALINSGRAADI